EKAATPSKVTYERELTSFIRSPYDESDRALHGSCQRRDVGVSSVSAVIASSTQRANDYGLGKAAASQRGARKLVGEASGHAGNGIVKLVPAEGLEPPTP